MATTTIGSVTTVNSISDTDKLPISVGDSQAHTVSVSLLKDYIRRNQVNWLEVDEKPEFDDVAFDGVMTINNQSIVGSGNLTVEAESVDWQNVENAPTIPTAVSDLTNDEGFLTSADLKTVNNQSIVGSGNITVSGGSSDWDDITNKPTFATVATSGEYQDLVNPPTNLSDFNNDTDFAVASDLATVATTGDYDDLDNTPSFKTVNGTSIIGTGDISVNASQTKTTITSTSPTVAVAGNTVYECQNPITSLTISSIPSNTTAESELYFTAGGNFTVAFSSRPANIFGSLDCVSGAYYAMSFKDGVVAIATPNAVEPFSTATIIYKDANGNNASMNVLVPNT